MALNIETALFIQSIVLIFGSGIAYNKLLTVENKVNDLKDHSERLAKAETEIKNLKKELQ